MPIKNTCGKCGDDATTRCSACGAKYYCATECQREDWPVHKTECKQKPLLLYVKIENEPWFNDIYSGLSTYLKQHFRFREAKKAWVIKDCLEGSHPPAAILISDSGIRKEKYSETASAMVSYARNGGRVVFATGFSNTIPAQGFRDFFSNV